MNFLLADLVRDIQKETIATAKTVGTPTRDMLRAYKRWQDLVVSVVAKHGNLRIVGMDGPHSIRPHSWIEGCGIPFTQQTIYFISNDTYTIYDTLIVRHIFEQKAGTIESHRMQLIHDNGSSQTATPVDPPPRKIVVTLEGIRQAAENAGLVFIEGSKP